MFVNIDVGFEFGEWKKIKLMVKLKYKLSI